jgi:ABC-type uncharacterized transport system involved in gliding motility auxiliary subunit
MHPSRKWQLRLVNIAFVALFLVAIGLLQWLSREYRWQFDLTQNSRHSLSDASRAVLERLSGPVTITAYATQKGDVRRQVSEFVSRYQRHKPDIALSFVDPDAEPERTRAAGVQFDGELIIQFGESKENLAPNRLSEEQFTHALTRLGHRGERWIVFLSGHGERSPDRQANFDFSIWAAELKKRGFLTRTLSLGDHPQIPQNTSALVIAGPRTKLLAGEVQALDKYLRDGGNLLWLHDPGPLHGLQPLAEFLGVEFQPGTIVDPSSQVITGSATAVVVAKYGAHAIVRNFADLTVFPEAAGIALASKATGKDAKSNFQSQVLFDTRASSWSETSGLRGAVEFDKGKDIKGPHNLAVALTREVDHASGAKREQRVAVLGDGDFLANSYLGNAGNLELGMSLINWLSQDDAFVNIPVRARADKALTLTRNVQATLAGGFLIGIPLLLIASGITIWWRRRKR